MKLRLLHPLGLCLVYAALASSKKDQPDVHETKLASRPSNLFYFQDSDVVIIHDTQPGIIYRSTDAGATWTKADGVPESQSLEVLPHPFDNKLAIIVGTAKTHWITKDQGETWSPFTTDDMPVLGSATVNFHATDSDKIIFLTAKCDGFDCVGKSLYTTDAFKTQHSLREHVSNCHWAKSTPRFTTGDDHMDANRILCVAEGKYSNWMKDQRMLISDDYFESEDEPKMQAGRAVPGIINMATVTGYLTVAARSEGTSELALYVTDDTIQWHRAEFGDHALEEEAYTILESTNYSIQVDVKTGSHMTEMGSLFTSNSNGTYFTETIKHTNRNMLGYVDFEKIQNIQGIVLVNTVENWEDVEKSWLTSKKISTKISFDDGRSWSDMMVGDKKLNLHSVTAQRNQGRIFTSPAPGIVMGIGNTGPTLNPWQECDTYVSDDAGITWTLALEKPHLYEMGDQGAILVAVEDAETDKIKWSINHGKDWNTYSLDDKFRPAVLETVADSTSLKFVLVTTRGSGSALEWYIQAIDFEGLHEDKCSKSDFEKWPARVDGAGKPSCIMGHKQFYRRRKSDADCFVDQEFTDPEPEYEDCVCTDADYECDYDFFLDDHTCVPVTALNAPEGACKDPEGTFKGSSGFRKIPGNTCIKKGGVDKDKPVERPCKDTLKTPASGKISHEITAFKKASRILEYFYLERKGSGHGDDETIIMRTDRHETYITSDHGKTWRTALPDADDEIVAIYPHQYFSELVYLITTSKRVYYSPNRGKTFHHFDAPEVPNQDRLQILSFHPDEKDWLLWTGGKDCTGWGADCHSVAHVSRKGGEDWTTLLPYVRKCRFVWREGRKDSEKLIFCEQYASEDRSNPVQLVASDDWFEHKTTHFDDVISFATMSEFIIVALRDEDQKTLRVDASIDGKTFANAQFPSNFQVPHQRAYTVLDSSTHAVFLHVTVNNRQAQEYGSIIKSNSNGTSYVLSASHVNRNTMGYVDFEKMQGLEGVALINVVSNVDDVDIGAAKKLKTMMTHNDGAEWGYIKPPTKDSDGKPYSCEDSVLEKCSLHLHGYTERKDPRDTVSSPSAIGLMMAVGNVGPVLGAYKDGDTFVTRDGGITWHEVFKGTYMWEYGDQGSLIVIVREEEPVNAIYYSRDEGQTWQAYAFGTRDRKLSIYDVSTVPSDTSRNFLLWGRDGADPVTVNLDFSGLTDKVCSLNEDNPDASDSDYTLWKPKHPLSDSDCLFGHVAEFHRKKLDSNCYNGAEIRHLHDIERNCSCTRQDFECDYNYERQPDGSCKLVPGLDPPDHKAICTEDPSVDEWFEPTGYRRIPLTTCQGGKEMEYTAGRHACPGKEDIVRKKHGISGAGLFFAILLPICAAVGAGWWVYQNWDGKFGRIRLGDGMAGFAGSGSGAGAGLFDSDSPLVRIPVAIASGLVAVVAALPPVLGAIWRAISSRVGLGGDSHAYSRPYTTRDSFQRGRTADFVPVEDEGELLGEDSDEEVLG